MKVTLLFFDGCPHWQLGHERMQKALEQIGADPDGLRLVQIRTREDAKRWQFRGSPTFLVNGRNPFDAPGAQVGLAYRIYKTTDGHAGTPTVAELVAALDVSGDRLS